MKIFPTFQGGGGCPVLQQYQGAQRSTPRFGKLSGTQDTFLGRIREGDAAALERVETLYAEAVVDSQPRKLAADEQTTTYADLRTTFHTGFARKILAIRDLPVLDAEIAAVKADNEWQPSMSSLGFLTLAKRLKTLVHGDK